MRRFMVRLVTEIDFVDGENVSEAIVRDYQKHLSESVQDAAQHLPAADDQGRQGRQRFGYRNQG
jgi:hypothetical protein